MEEKNKNEREKRERERDSSWHRSIDSIISSFRASKIFRKKKKKKKEKEKKYSIFSLLVEENSILSIVFFSSPRFVIKYYTSERERERFVNA